MLFISAFMYNDSITWPYTFGWMGIMNELKTGKKESSLCCVLLHTYSKVGMVRKKNRKIETRHTD